MQKDALGQPLTAKAIMEALSKESIVMKRSSTNRVLRRLRRAEGGGQTSTSTPAQFPVATVGHKGTVALTAVAWRVGLYDKLSKDSAKCKHCGTVVSVAGTNTILTQQMRTHLRTAGHEEYRVSLVTILSWERVWGISRRFGYVCKFQTRYEQLQQAEKDMERTNELPYYRMQKKQRGRKFTRKNKKEK